jgi:hypothetical protein
MMSAADRLTEGAACSPPGFFLTAPTRLDLADVLRLHGRVEG